MTTEAVLNREIDKARLSLFIPSNAELGDVHVMSFKDGVLIDCRCIRPSYIQGIKWMLAHMDEEEMM